MARNGDTGIPSTEAEFPLEAVLRLRRSAFWMIPSGKPTVCYSKWPLFVSFPIENGDFP